MIQNSKFTIQH